MTDRIPVIKTCKLYINGAFPRSESGRVLPLRNGEWGVVAQIAHASRKDLRDAVEAASAAQPKWAAATAYNRGQVLYRIAEMMEARSGELVATIRDIDDVSPAAAKREVEASIDRVVRFAGWTDKIAQVLGNQNPVAGPYYNFTVPEATGVVAVVAPNAPSLLGLVTLLCAPLCAGNAVIAISSDSNPLPAVSLMEILATSDVPAGVVNILTGQRSELLGHLATHREINAISAATADAKEARTLELGAAENLKRVRIVRDAKPDARPDWSDDDRFAGPWSIEPFVEMKTIWHPCST
ncbi:MAG: aldehyde dehydrogenase family protein [Phycisphaerae bacterium]|jgi:acyl-CoA reductase-like NAD-dependent aldehyde dehydrogenase|nr:aldehyde dehydrogenase family protein [Phycisphaerae bacterium]